MPKKKVKGEKVLTEHQAEEQFEIVRGFNLTRENGEIRFDVGKTKPNYITEKEFTDEHSIGEWKDLIKLGAIVPVLKPEETAEGLENPDLPAPEEN